jgi:hypothetical protein
VSSLTVFSALSVVVGDEKSTSSQAIDLTKANVSQSMQRN